MQGTTVLSVRRGEYVAVGADGQVSLGDTIVKHNAVKVRRLGEGRVLVGFAGAAADSLSLLERFEEFLGKYGGNTLRAATELAKLWRTDRALRRLESVLAVADPGISLLVSGTGDVIEPADGVIGIGSGGPYAAAAARALLRHTELSAAEIVRESLGIAAEICVYTNRELCVEELCVR
jgi:ATP-dependent HslUV protease subunit HslV